MEQRTNTQAVGRVTSSNTARHCSMQLRSHDDFPVGAYITPASDPRRQFSDGQRMFLLELGTALLALGALLSATATAAPLPAPAHFYPYGPGVGDRTAPVNDDGSTGVIPISTPFPYFDVPHESLYVSTRDWY